MFSFQGGAFGDRGRVGSLIRRQSSPFPKAVNTPSPAAVMISRTTNSHTNCVALATADKRRSSTLICLWIEAHAFVSVSVTRRISGEASG